MKSSQYNKQQEQLVLALTYSHSIHTNTARLDNLPRASNTLLVSVYPNPDPTTVGQTSSINHRIPRIIYHLSSGAYIHHLIHHQPFQLVCQSPKGLHR